MEYLMTYGWAILIIAIVLVAMFEFGVFSQYALAPKAQPGSCEVYRSVAGTDLAGQCTNAIPEYVAQSSGPCEYYSYNSIGCKNYVTAGSNPIFNSLSRNVTVSGWIYFKDTSDGYDYIASNDRDVPGPYFGYALYAYSGDPEFRIWDTSGALHNVAGSKLSRDTWYQLVGTFNGNNLDIYVDGKLSASASVQTEMGTPASFPLELGSLGYNAGIGSYGINGSISNVQIYNTTLDASAVESLYQEGIGGVPVDVQNLVGWWPLNGNADDYSGNDNDGSVTNMDFASSWYSGYTQP